MIEQTTAVTHPSLPGVRVFSLDSGTLQKRKPQQVLVVVEPNGVIPSHQHDCDASMFVVAGEAEVVSDNPEFDGQKVSLGSKVFFQKKQNHGFRAGPMGLEFISTNNGIVGQDGNWDLQFAK